MGSKSQTFLGLSAESQEARAAKVAVIQAPLENTTSYQHGTALGPQAILCASSQVECRDMESGLDFTEIGIATFDAPVLKGLANDKALERIEHDVERALNQGQWPVTLGGEHTVSLAPLRALHKRHPGLTVLQIDAHADLRDTYEGSPLSHACVMRRVWELGVPVVGVGIRNMSAEEAEFAAQKQAHIFAAHTIKREGLDPARISAALGAKVYITVDIDGFDPSECPGTGTPEPGGLSWWQGLDLLKYVFKHHEVVGIDINEVRPIESDARTEFFAARMAYQMIGYKFFTRQTCG